MGIALRALAASLLAAAPPCAGLAARPEILVREGSRIVCRPAVPAEAASLLARRGTAAVHVLARARRPLAAGGLKIVLRGTAQLDANPAARDAFLRAAARWESLLATPVTVVIDVDYGDTAFGEAFPADGIVGLTTPKDALSAWSTVRAALVANGAGKVALYNALPSGPVPADLGAVSWIHATAANFRAIGLLPAVEDPDAEAAAYGPPTRIAFRSDAYDFDPSDGVAVDAYDFDALAAHEIGHALGLVSRAGVFRDPKDPLDMGPQDLFRFPSSFTTPDLSASPRILSAGGSPVFVAAGAPLPLSNGVDFGASHWKSEWATGRAIGIMDPLAVPGVRGTVTARDLALLDAIGWTVAGPPAPEPSVRTIPIVLDVAGASGARFSTELTLANRSMAPADVTLLYTPAASLGATGGGSAAFSLAAFQQILVPDALAWLRDRGIPVPATGNQGGTLTLTFRADASPDSFAASARTTSPAGGGRAGLGYPALRAVDAVAARRYVFGLRETPQERSNLALLNMGTGPVSLRVTLRDGSGRASYVLPDIPLDGGQWRQLDRVLGSAGFTSGWAEIERVSGTQPWASYGVFNDNATNDGSYVPGASAPLAAAPQRLPVLVETAVFSSELVLTNPGAGPATVTVAYVESASAGSGAGGSATLSMAPFEQRILPEAVDWLRRSGAAIGPRGAATTYAGTATVTFTAGGATAPGLVGARASASGDGGSYGLFAPGEPLSGFLFDTWVFGLRQDAQSRSNLAVLNTGDANAPLTLHVELFDGATGRQLGATAPFTLGPGAWTQFGAILGGFGISSGYARIVYDDGHGSFSAYGVVNDGATPASGGTNDGSFIAASKR